MARKVCLITGASRGIGRAIALEFADAGYDIAFCYQKNADRARAVASEITAKGAAVCARSATWKFSTK